MSQEVVFIEKLMESSQMFSRVLGEGNFWYPSKLAGFLIIISAFAYTLNFTIRRFIFRQTCVSRNPK